MKRLQQVMLLVLLFLICGCGTTKHAFIKTISQNQSLTPLEADKKFGTPIDIQFLRDGIQYRVYKIYESWDSSFPDRIAVYFANNKFLDYGEHNDFYHLGMAKRLGFISEAEYEMYYNQAVEAANARRQALIPLLGIIQNMEAQRQNQQFQEQYLSNQQKMLELQKKQLNKPSSTQIIGGQKRTDCYTDSFGNIHCTTQ